jgi:hypothetical protein
VKVKDVLRSYHVITCCVPSGMDDQVMDGSLDCARNSVYSTVRMHEYVNLNLLLERTSKYGMKRGPTLNRKIY